MNATKPSSSVSLSRAYIFHACADPELLNKLWEVVEYGLSEYDGVEVRPFLMLFQQLLQAANDGYPLFKQRMPFMLHNYFGKILKRNACFFQFMEMNLEFVFKVYNRLPLVRSYMQEN